MKIKPQEEIPLSVSIKIISPQFDQLVCTVDGFHFPKYSCLQSIHPYGLQWSKPKSEIKVDEEMNPTPRNTHSSAQI